MILSYYVTAVEVDLQKAERFFFCPKNIANDDFALDKQCQQIKLIASNAN